MNKKLSIEEIQEMAERNQIPLRIQSLDNLLVSVTFTDPIRPKIEYDSSATDYDEVTIKTEVKKVIDSMIKEAIILDDI